MKIPEHFLEWLNHYGIMDDYIQDYVVYDKVKRIAWRSYRKGRADYKKKYNNANEPEFHLDIEPEEWNILDCAVCGRRDCECY